MTRFVTPAPDRALAATDRVRAAYRRIAEVARPEVWIHLREEAAVLADAADLERRVAGGGPLPLAGLLVAVKDNVDVAGLPTTAACPEYAYHPRRSATAVARLVDAGALVLGKTNLDQFATGLVGTRSPYGAVRCAWDPARVSGGSSSGSAAAVGLGVVDLGVGTDTAGSGRVPAAFQGIVGLKASPGIVPATGVVPACADYDCVTVFAADLPTARHALAVMSGPDPADPRSRAWPADVRLAAPARPRLAVPRDTDLAPATPGYRAAFAAAVDRLVAGGATVTEIDISPLLEAALLLYDGAVVAERHAAVGAFLATGPAGADPVVAGIIRAAADVSGSAFAADLGHLASAAAHARAALAGSDALLLPVTTEHPTIAAVLADPLGINRRLGTYTNFANLLDMAAMAVPAGEADGGPFGVMVVVPAMDDHVALDLAARLTAEAPSGSAPAGSAPPPLSGDVVDLLVVGAHLRGQPLNGDLERLGARFVSAAATSDAYRMVALPTATAKPGLVRHGAGLGAPIAGELWQLSPGGLGRFLAGLPAPMGLGPVELADGRWVTGFCCSAEAGASGTDITAYGGWRAYLAARADAHAAAPG
ncbi:MAG TPA: allophanate hydrolase [Pseudonocardia sp.]|jgi:allophanate hydrolase